jgi:hypothetical protein
MLNITDILELTIGQLKESKVLTQSGVATHLRWRKA